MNSFNIKAVDEQANTHIEVNDLRLGGQTSPHLVAGTIGSTPREKSFSYLINAHIQDFGDTKSIRLLLGTDELFLINGGVLSNGKKFRISDSRDADLIKLHIYKAQLGSYNSEIQAGAVSDIEMYNLVKAKIAELEEKVKQPY